MRNTITTFLITILLFTSAGYAQTSGGRSSANTAKLVERVKKYSANNTKVKVSMNIGDTFKGRITRYSDTDFTLQETKSGTERVLEYSKVERVEKDKVISTAAIIALAAIGAGGAIITGVLLTRCRNEGGC